MWRSRAGAVWLAGGALVAATVLLTGCSGSGIGESLPKSLGGLPEGAPARPTSAGHFPAVHDIPPPRADKPLTVDQQIDLEDELKALRDRQSREVQQSDAEEGEASPAKPVTKPATRSSGKPSAKTGQSAAGARRNP